MGFLWFSSDKQLGKCDPTDFEQDILVRLSIIQVKVFIEDAVKRLYSSAFQCNHLICTVHQILRLFECKLCFCSAFHNVWMVKVVMKTLINPPHYLRLLLFLLLSRTMGFYVSFNRIMRNLNQS